MISDLERSKFPSILRSTAWVGGIIAPALLAVCVFLTPSASAGTYDPPPESRGGRQTLVTRNALASVGTPATLFMQTRVDDIPRLGIFEKCFRHSGVYDNPYKDLTAWAILRRPDGKEWRMPLFWDGAAVWTLRVSPEMIGEWSYSIHCPDPGLNARTGSFRCVASNRHGSIQPMRDHPLHFQYQDGKPFWFFGEKAWRVFQRDRAEKLDHASAMHHVDVRAEQGFNYLHTELAGTGGLTSGGNEGGEMFLDAGKEVINPAFCQEVDSRLRHINEKGMICGMVLLYARGDPCWKSLPDDEARLRFARYVVARYAAFDIVFLVAGEWHFMAKQPDLFRTIGREIRKTDPHGRMIGIHPGPESVGISSQEFAGDDWMSFGEYAQAYFAPHAREATDADRDSLRQFIVAARKHNKPVVNAEYAYYLRDQDYDGSVDKPHSHTRDSFRRASWAIAMGGGYFVTGFGTTYFGGRREVGPFLVDNPRHQDAVSDLGHLHTFFTALPWWVLEPHDEWVTTNGGYAYCLADAGKTYVIYVAGGKGTTLKTAGGAYSVARYDPRTGQSTELPAPTGEVVQLVAPGPQDWVFLVKARVGVGVAAEKPPAVSVDDFLNSLGVCTHIGQGIDNPVQSAAALAYAGLRNIRDDGSPRHLQDWISVHKQAGVKVVLTWSGPNDDAISSLLSTSKKLAAAGALLALEGPNEANNWAVTYEGQKSQANVTFLPVAKWQRAFYERVKSDPVLKDYPVFHASEGGGAEPDNVGLQFLTIPADANTLMPAGTKYADYANVHNYICRRPSIIDNMAWLNADPLFHGWTDGIYAEYGKTWRKGFAGYSNADLVTLPRVTTETGWVTGDKGLTQEQQGRLYLNLYLAQFKQGFKYTFIYMLRDARGSDAGYGMFERDYHPKRSATYLHNLTMILSDNGVSQPGRLNYTIPDQPATVHDLLLQKGNGTFELVVWNEKADGTNNVTVDLGDAYSSVKVYDPTTGIAPTETLTDARSISLTLSDHPVVIEILRQP